ncbi:hypothetical protein HK097_005807 [Rhizophlyctis rosea]|uniref:NodB homology domain-containing protein n=1 Tax=Rhizophlyctis rosea TaxID=64517 RepID=A0AAD5SDY7_9FUNG|nr:hypothetical protein HK097_005807 [Rhizophlyctis rosea]
MAAAGFKTTFFVNGRGFYGCIYDGASTLLSAYRAGHQIASHSWAHLHMTTLSTSQQQSEIQRVDQALQKIIGAKPTYMRAPFGETNSALQEVARQQGYRAMINWDIDSEDWNNQSPSYSFNKVQSQSYSSNGHIILMHENYQNTVQTLLPQIISWAKSKGVKLVTVGECLGESSSLWYRDVRSPQSRDSSWTC